DEGSGQQKSGLSLRNVDPRYAQNANLSTDGALVADVAPGSPAEHAGLVPGMGITEINKKPVHNSSEANRALKAAKPGSTVLLRTISRGGSGPDASPTPSIHALTIP